VNDYIYTRGRCENIVRSIHREMPHLTAADLKHAFNVRAEEHRLDTAVLAAEEEASAEIVDILREVAQTSALDEGQMNIARCRPILPSNTFMPAWWRLCTGRRRAGKAVRGQKRPANGFIFLPGYPTSPAREKPS
jgi:hypothetical protein